jgi:hypothetical protein
MPNREKLTASPAPENGKVSTREGWVIIGFCLLGFASMVFFVSISSVVNLAAAG